MLPVLQIGPLAIQTPGLVLLLGLWVGLSLAERHAARYQVDPQAFYNLALAALLAGVIGARLAYVARYPGAFAANWGSIFSLNPGLLDPFGGLACALVAGLAYGQRKKMGFWPTLDALTSALAVMAVALGLANLASGDAFGAPADLPWSITLWGTRRHPSQVYEVLAASIILGICWPRGNAALLRFSPGTRFLLFVACSAGARLFLEAFRGDSDFLPYGLRSAQVIAWLVLAAGLWGLGRLNRR